MTGRKPMPATLISASDMKRSKEEVNARAEIEKKLMTADNLSCPHHMSALAKKEWRRIMRLYKQMDAKILNDLDVTALTMYCESVAMYKTAQQQWIKVNQVVSSTKEGQRMLDKIRIVMNDQTKVVCQLSEQLCLTPVGRARMGVASKEEEQENPIFALLKEYEDD